jgi:hypothetical protein
LPDASTTTLSTPPAIENFRGDFSAVASLIQSSWAENGQQPLLYTSDLLASYFACPGFDRSLAPTLYEGNKPSAFIAGFPRRLRYKGRDLRVIISSFLSVSREYKNKGYGVILWSELVKRARAAGFDGMVNYCVDGEPMNAIIMGCCRMLKLPTARFFTVHHQMRILPPARASDSAVAHRNTVDAETLRTFLEAAEALADRVPLARIWTDAEAEWQCRRHGAIVAHSVSGTRRGVVTGYLTEIANAQRTKIVLIEDLLWGTLDPGERHALFQSLFEKAAAAGAKMAIVPCLNPADAEMLRASRFRSAARILQGYLTIFTGDPAPQEVPSMYLDVF